MFMTETKQKEQAMAVYALGEDVPEIDSSAFVFPSAVVIGRVRIGADSTVWPNAVLRGDNGDIVIGTRTSIQDGVVVHATQQHPTHIGDDCVIGHIAHLEGCAVEDRCLIGAGSVVLAGVTVRRGALVGAGAVVTPATEVPPRAKALGVPARIVPDSVPEDAVVQTVQRYVASGRRYGAELRCLDPV